MISELEFREFIKLYSNLFSVSFDESQANDWHRVLGKLKVRGLIFSIQALCLETTFPPKIKEIVDKYDELKRWQEKEDRDKRIAEQQKYLLSQTKGQYRCPLCENTGNYIYFKNGYEHYSRCICAHGKDLNKWSEYQLSKELKWHDSNNNKDKSLYILAIDDIFTEEEIEIIRIKNMEIHEEIEFRQIKSMFDNFKIMN